MEFTYFHIPTKIVQGYESFHNLSEVPQLNYKRVMMVTDSNLIKLGATQKLRRFIENLSYGLIIYEVSADHNLGVPQEAIKLVQDSKIQTIVGFGPTYTLSCARAMAQFGENTLDQPVSYIEIPSMPCIYSGLLETYYIADEHQTLKKPHKDKASCAEWLFLDSSYTEFSRVGDILSSSVQSLAYALDALISRSANVLSESYALKAIELIVTAGNRLPNEPTNIQIKHELMVASLLSTFAIQSASLGITAGLSMAMENVSVCSESQASGALLMSVLEYSLVTNTAQFQKIYRILGLGSAQDPLESSMEVLKVLQQLLIQMEVKPLSHYTLTSNTVDLIAKQASHYKFILDLSKPAGFYELTDILNNAIHNGTGLSQSIVSTKTSEQEEVYGVINEEDVTYEETVPEELVDPSETSSDETE